MKNIPPLSAQTTNCNLDGGKQISCVDWIHSNKQKRMCVNEKLGKTCEVKIKNREFVLFVFICFLDRVQLAQNFN